MLYEKDQISPNGIVLCVAGFEKDLGDIPCLP